MRIFSKLTIIMSLWLALVFTLNSCGEVESKPKGKATGSSASKGGSSSSGSLLEEPPDINEPDITVACDLETIDTLTHFCYGVQDINGKAVKNSDKEDSVAVAAKCSGEKYNPYVRFCSNNRFYFLCEKDEDKNNGKDYNPATHFCFRENVNDVKGVISLRCGSDLVDPDNQFCFDGKVEDKCEGTIFNPLEQFCDLKTDKLYFLCGKEKYDPEIQWCDRLDVVSICGGKTFDPKDFVCYEDNLYTKGSKCSNKSAEFCDANGNYKVCEGKKYNIDTEFCTKDNNVLQKCEGQYTYEPSEDQFCPKLGGGVKTKCIKVIPGELGAPPTYIKNEFEPTTHFCQNGDVLPLPRPQQCDPDSLSKYPRETYFCCFGKYYPKKGDYFCKDNELYPRCGRAFNTDKDSVPYNPYDSICYNGNSVKPKCLETGKTGPCVNGGSLRCKQLGDGARYIVDPMPGMKCEDNGAITGTISNESYKIVQIGTQMWLAEDVKRESKYWRVDSTYIRISDNTQIRKASILSEISYNRTIEDTLIGGVNTKIITASTRIYGYYDWANAITPYATEDCNGTNEGDCAGKANIIRQGLCPYPFGVPKVEDWNTLIDYAGGAAIAGSRLKSTGTEWNKNINGNTIYDLKGNGTDSYGFNAKPNGYYEGVVDVLLTDPRDVGFRAMWWVDDVSKMSEADYITIINPDSEVRRNFQQKGAYLAALRCVHYF